MNISKGFSILSSFVKVNSPTILTTISVVGLISTVVAAIKATPTVMDKIENKVGEMYYRDMEDPNQKMLTFEEWLGARNTTKNQMAMLTKTEIIQLIWRDYLPVLALGGISIACTIGANRISLRRSAALASLYSLTENAFREYKSKVVETIGDSRERKVRDCVDKDMVENNPMSDKNTFIVSGRGEVLCYDSLSGRYFKSDIDKIQRAINELNRDMMTDMFISVNDLYDKIGLPNTSIGYDLGWNIDKGLIELDFSAQLTPDGEPCLVLSFKVNPKYER